MGQCMGQGKHDDGGKGRGTLYMMNQDKIILIMNSPDFDARLARVAQCERERRNEFAEMKAKVAALESIVFALVCVLAFLIQKDNCK